MAAAAVGAWLLHGAAATAAIEFEEPAPEVSAPGRAARPMAPPRRGRPAPPAPGRVQAEPGTPGWLTDPRSRCSVWVWDPQPGETVAWVGGCRGGEASGGGEVLRRVGDSVVGLYTGAFEAGRQVGPGYRVYADSVRIEAVFVDGRANGPGTVVYPDGGRYEGEFVDDLAQGRGVRTWPGGAWYDGEWRAGRPAGQGTMQYASGDRYEGGWREGMWHGVGVLRWYAPGRSGVYRGEWRDNLRHGFGEEFFAPEGAVYEGGYVDGRPEGHGVYTVGGRARYEGEVSGGGCLRTAWRAVRIAGWSAACR